jgi:hypothetical protein
VLTAPSVLNWKCDIGKGHIRPSAVCKAVQAAL